MKSAYVVDFFRYLLDLWKKGRFQHMVAIRLQISSAHTFAPKHGYFIMERMYFQFTTYRRASPILFHSVNMYKSLRIRGISCKSLSAAIFVTQTAKIILPKVLVPLLTKKMTVLTVKTIVKTNSNNRYENKTA